jgi:Mor family transcriptional regulator
MGYDSKIVSDYEQGKDCACLASVYNLSVDEVKEILVNSGYNEEDLRI